MIALCLIDAKQVYETLSAFLENKQTRFTSVAIKIEFFCLILFILLLNWIIGVWIEVDDEDEAHDNWILVNKIKSSDKIWVSKNWYQNAKKKEFCEV